MKPLLERKVTRENKDEVEWKRAEEHLTHDGQVEFMARMKARIAAANGERSTAATNVKPIHREKKQ